MSFADPLFQHRRVARRFLDNVTNHPVHRLLGLEGETIRHQMLDQSGFHQAFGHRAVVDGGDQHATVDQLPGPAARRGAKVDAGHVAVQAVFPLITWNEVVPRLLQLQGRTARCLARKLQARDAHRPHRRIAGIGHAEKHFATTFEGQQQTRLAGVFHQFASGGQRLAQRAFELFAEIRQFLAVIGIDHFQPQTAKHREIGHVREDYADAIVFRQIDEKAARPLPREDQFGETLTAHQAFGAVGFGADKLGAGRGGFGFGVTGDIETGGEIGNLRTDFAFEAGPAMHE